jgi:hypothetical protein
MIDDERTEELPAPPVHRPRSALVGLTAVLVAALVILACAIIGAQIAAAQRDQPGPGAWSLVAHLVAAAAGVVGYRLASRRHTGAVRPVVCAAVLMIAALLLWFFWWAA